jgi:hypothetical protein
MGHKGIGWEGVKEIHLAEPYQYDSEPLDFINCWELLE